MGCALHRVFLGCGISPLCPRLPVRVTQRLPGRCPEAPSPSLLCLWPGSPRRPLPAFSSSSSSSFSSPPGPECAPRAAAAGPATPVPYMCIRV